MTNRQFTVIVVEDEKLIANNLSKNIEFANSNFKVIGIASNGEDALELIKKQPPNVVFTDIRMPVMNGIELIKNISSENPYIKCIIISGYSDFEYARKAINYGIYNYVLKPVDKEELSEILRKLELEFISSQKDFSIDTQMGEYKPKEIIQMMKDYLYKNYATPFDLNTISDQLGFSASYLSKIFKKQEAVAPSKFFRSFRIQKAKQLLSDSDLPINVVGEMVGYPDPFHFSKSFKMETGISPAAYRKQINM